MKEQRSVPNSPRIRNRRTSGPVSPALRPVFIDRDENVIDDSEFDGPEPIAKHGGPAVDEVELIFQV